MADRTLLTRCQVASRLGLTVERLYRQRRELEADGFPAPALGRMSGERWDPVAIDRWLDAKLKGERMEIRAPVDIRIADEWADRLDRRVDLVAGAGE